MGESPGSDVFIFINFIKASWVWSLIILQIQQKKVAIKNEIDLIHMGLLFVLLILGKYVSNIIYIDNGFLRNIYFPWINGDETDYKSNTNEENFYFTQDPEEI